ncbi:MAG: hybrid sensor histidine kinase/response regulator [Limnospira sp.]
MKTILVIEDEAYVREIILDILDAEGFGILGAENGKFGVQVARERSPDLIICDVMMPEMDGYEVLKALREPPETATIPFIFLTAKSTRSDIRSGMDLGADDYLTKPFTRQELLGAIASRIQKQEAVDRKTQEQLEQLRSSITLSLPHELRTPLNGIMASSQLLMEDFKEMNEGEIETFLGDIYNSAHRLYRLTCNFLLYSDLELLKRDPERLKRLPTGTVEDPSSTIISVADRLLESYCDRALDLHLHLTHHLEIEVPKTVFQKIVEELLDNALKFSLPETPVTVKDSVQIDKYCLEVGDRGRGMTATQIANLGKNFDRSKSDGVGFGLGLILVRRLSELHGGHFTIESIPGEQTTARVLFPLCSLS